MIDILYFTTVLRAGLYPLDSTERLTLEWGPDGSEYYQSLIGYSLDSTRTRLGTVLREKLSPVSRAMLYDETKDRM